MDSKLAMPSTPNASAHLQPGRVTRLNLGAGFGYVQTEDGVHSYIFLVWRALRHAQANKLRVGQPVQFRLGELGRVNEVRPA